MFNKNALLVSKNAKATLFGWLFAVRTGLVIDEVAFVAERRKNSDRWSRVRVHAPKQKSFLGRKLLRCVRDSNP